MLSMLLIIVWRRHNRMPRFVPSGDVFTSGDQKNASSASETDMASSAGRGTGETGNGSLNLSRAMSKSVPQRISWG